RGLGVSDYAKFAAILAATGFFQVLLALTGEDALVKCGFRYVETEQWGKLRRMFEIALGFKLAGGVLAGIAIAGLAPFAQQVWGVGGVLGAMLSARSAQQVWGAGVVRVPMRIAALLRVVQAHETVAGGAIILRGRYDVRG